MQRVQRDQIHRALLAFGIVVLLAAYSQRALQNLNRIDYRNSNFVFFWLAGRMVLLGENPYDHDLWLAQQAANRVTWQPDRIFPYPLPLALFLAPLGLLSLDAAYVAWQLLTGLLVATASLLVLRVAGAVRAHAAWFALGLALLFFGPVYLTLQIGALGGLLLAAMTAAILALDQRRAFPAGLLLSLVLLKPPQGLPLLVLGVVWLLFQRSWRALAGLACGALALLVVGLLLDPSWPLRFLSSSQDFVTRNLGVQSTIFSLAWHACPPVGACTWILGGAAAILIDAVTMVYLLRRKPVTQVEAFSVIIPVACVTAVYAWSYDQILYVIPIAWVIAKLASRRRGYLAALAFGVIVLIASILALAVHAYTGTDLLSSLTSLVVLAGIGFVQATSVPNSN